MLQDKLSNLPSSDFFGIPNFIRSSVIIPLLLEGDNATVLFEKRAANISHSNEICFPGGRFDIEKDSNSVETALRELEEELGIAPDKVTITSYLGPYISHTDTIIDVYVGTIASSILAHIHPQASEVASVLSIPLTYFLETEPAIYELDNWSFPYKIVDDKKEILFPTKDLQLPEKYHQPWKLLARQVYAYPTHGGVIWGITAHILYHFITLLKKEQ